MKCHSTVRMSRCKCILAASLISMLFQGCIIARVGDYSQSTELNLGYILGLLLQICNNPDRIAFNSLIDGDNEIYSMDLAGTELQQLTFNSTSDTSPSWSPNGMQIAFQGNRLGVDGIYLINSDGSNERALVVDGFVNQLPAFAPDGQGIYFASNRGGSTQEIHHLDLNTFVITQITNSAGAYDNVSPAVSPGSDYVYFNTTFSGNDDIARIRKDGSDFSVIVTDPNSDLEPAISRDGTMLLFTADRDGNQEIYMAQPDGLNQINFSSDGGNDGAAAFSPDGRQIVFASDRPISDQEIYTISMDGTGLTQLTSNSTLDTDPTWSCR